MNSQITSAEIPSGIKKQKNMDRSLLKISAKKSQLKHTYVRPKPSTDSKVELKVILYWNQSGTQEPSMTSTLHSSKPYKTRKVKPGS